MKSNLIQEAINKFNIKVATIINVPDSFSSQVVKLILTTGEKVILKIPYNRKKLLREFSVLNLLKDKIPVPKVLDFFDEGFDKGGALLLSYIDGESILGNVHKDISYQMGELLGKLHSVSSEYFGDIRNSNKVSKENDWWKMIFDWFQDWIPLCEKALSKDILYNCIDFFKEMYEDLPKPDGPCVIHLDYRPANILVKGNKIAGLIDFESSRYGSADIDFTKVKLEVWDKNIGAKVQFLKGYSSVRNVPYIEKTLPFYLFYNAFGGVGWCVKRKSLDSLFFKENIEQLKYILDQK